MNLMKELEKRETGTVVPHEFKSRAGSSRGLISKLNIDKVLPIQGGSVDCTSFSFEGGYVLCGCENREIYVWNWNLGTRIWSFDSGHLRSINGVKTLPQTDCTSIISTSLDGDVNLFQFKEGSKYPIRSHLANHPESSTAIVIGPNPKCFFSSGVDGVIRSYDLRVKKSSEVLLSELDPVDCMAKNPTRPSNLAIGGDGNLARVFDYRKTQLRGEEFLEVFCPPHLIKMENMVSITSLDYSWKGDILLLYSGHYNIYNLEDIHECSIFQFDSKKGLSMDDISKPIEDILEKARPSQKYTYDGQTSWNTGVEVKFFGPRSDYVVQGAEDGGISFWDKNGEPVLRKVADPQTLYSIDCHPSLPILASSGFDSNVRLWGPDSSGIVCLPDSD